ncbi:MAG: endonuclease III [Candidatus Brocadiia bacterium]
MTPSVEPYQLPPEEKTQPVLRALEKRYGRPTRKGDPDPLEVLVRGILSQNTSDVNSGRAYASLRARFGDWEALAEAGPGEIEEAIRSGGLAEQKAATIRGLMDWLSERDGYSLDFLEELDSGEAERQLRELKGVGVKTARLVLLFGLGRPVFVVDTHVHRVSLRLGLVPKGTTRDKAHKLLDELVPDADKYSGHLNMIRHGRRTCAARSPRCDDCPVQEWCLYVRDEMG